MSDRLRDDGFLVGETEIYPLDCKIITARGEQSLPPVAMELLCELAREDGEPVSAEHLLSQVWGAKAPDAGTLEHYISELNHTFVSATSTGPLIVRVGDGEYWLTQDIGSLAAQDKDSSVGRADRFVAELRKRKVSQTGVLYLVAAWLLLQFTDVAFDALGLGNEVVRLIMVALVIGFPITLVLSWFYDVTPASEKGKTKLQSQGAGYVFLGLLIALPIALAYQWFYKGDYLQFDSPDDPPAVQQSAEQDADYEAPANSIAVLAFSNLGGDQSYDYFGDGIAEEILNALSSTNKLLVAPRTSSFLYKQQATDIKNIGRQLGVLYVLEGSVRRVGSRVRVIVTLVNIATGFQAWSNSYDQEMSTIFDVQQDISKKIVQSLNIVLTEEKNEALGAAQTSDVEAFDYYLQGRDYLNRPVTQTSINSAIRLFDKSIELDPKYSDAYAGLCESYLQLYTETNTVEWYSKAETTCKETLRFDLKTVEMRIALGNLYRQSGNYDSALLQLGIALDRAPNNIDALSALAKTHAKIDNLQTAERLFLKAISVQPRFWKTQEQYGNFLFDTGRPAEAIEYYRKAIEVTPDNASAYNNLGAAFLMANRYQEAADAWGQSLALEDNESASSNAGTALFLASKFDEAAQMYQRAISISKDQHTLWGNLAEAQRLGSQPDDAQASYLKAIALAEQSLDINPNDRTTTAALSYYCANVGDSERALALVEQVLADKPSNLYVWYYASLTWLTLDKKDQAVQSLERAIELGYPKSMVNADPALRQLTSQASYRAQLGLQSEAM